MSTDNISSVVSSGASTASSSRTEDRARIKELAAEFESLLLSNVLKDMRSSGRWSTSENGADTLGAETFDQTIDVELSRYLARAGGFGLSERLLGAFDALARISDAATTLSASNAETLPSMSGDAGGETPANETIPTPRTSVGTGSTSTTTYAGRTGWNSMRLEAPPSGGSGADWGGFNMDRALAGGDENSVKDAFMRWTYGSSFNPAGKSKEEIGAFMRDNVQNAREYGLNILDVQGDQILIETKEMGPEWVDIVSNAGTAEGKWQWLCQSEYGVEVGGGALGTALANLRSSSEGDARVRALLSGSSLTGDALLESLNAEMATPSAIQQLPAQAARNASAAEQYLAQAAQVSSSFGWRNDPITGASAFHSGVDLRAAEGDPVTSTAAGRVVFAGEDGGYGNSVVVEHANGMTTRYAHLSETVVGVGDAVEYGQLLGLVGQTGRATGPHLHYEVRVDGKAVDPMQE